jgi:Na+/H+ antiporter NhaD/arsenite permease-like protein
MKRIASRAAILSWTVVIVLATLAVPGAADAAEGSLGESLPAASALPFVALLLSIAILPLVAGHWWESNLNKAIVSVALGTGFAAYLILAHGRAGSHALIHSIVYDYVPFIILLGALFVISGGIHVKGSLAGTPLSNTAIMAVGAVLANLIGTTGASMVLIRPVLRANEKRVRKSHIVIFFIFIVSNCGGLLTPLGDPPLFLGFLKGVPFEWTLGLWKEWLLVNGLLLVTFNFYDEYMLDREEKERSGSQLEAVMEHRPLRIEGWPNIAFLAGVVLVIVGKGQGWGAAGGEWPFGVQEGLMLALAVAAYATTRKETRSANKFTFGPIVEVAVLFIGIFATMVAPLEILNHMGRSGQLPIRHAWHFFWGTGMLSSFLDNAPTYLTFAAAAAGKLGVSTDGARYLGDLLALGGQAVTYLTAISCGAVMMGANTYIGNGPNFMVKAIAEENGVKMPSFFGYMAYSGAILIPIFLVVTMVFFR